nr:MAG TPA: hypothetical protein [Caudoviricetes sp.]
MFTICSLYVRIVIISKKVGFIYCISLSICIVFR